MSFSSSSRVDSFLEAFHQSYTSLNTTLSTGGGMHHKSSQKTRRARQTNRTPQTNRSKRLTHRSHPHQTTVSQLEKKVSAYLRRAHP